MERQIPYVHHRIVLKNGICNVTQPISNMHKLLVLRYVKLVDSSWIFTLSMFLFLLSLCWGVFAVFYWLICFSHGDFELNHLPEMQEESNFTPCIYDVRDFSSCLLFSMEAQHTVGYGIKAPTEECFEAIFVNSMHCIIGFILQGFMAAIVFSKMTVPRIRSQTLMFSKYAVICSKNEQKCLMFRIGDIRPKHIVKTTVRAFLIQSTQTENERILLTQSELSLQSDGCSESVFFNWPIVMYHVIGQESPIYSWKNFNKNNFEIMVVIEGTDENNGQVTQAVSSYMSDDILRDCKFEEMTNYNQLLDEYEADFSKFDNIVPVQSAPKKKCENIL